MQPKLGSLITELKTGAASSVHRRQIPLWETVSNVQFTDTGLRKSQGLSLPSTVTARAAPIRGMGQITYNDGTGHIFFGDDDVIYRWDLTGASTIVQSGVSGRVNDTATALATVHSFQAFGDWMINTNGSSVPKVMKGLTAGASLAGVTGNFARAEIVISLNEHIIMMNTDIGPYQIHWSSAGNAELWTPATTNTAGFLSLREARSPIVAAVKLQQFIGIYTKEDLFLLEYVGSPALRFRIIHALGGIGAYSKTSVVAVGGVHYGVGQQGFWRTDGATFQFIDDPAMRSTLRGLINLDQVTKINAFHNEEETSVVWHLHGGTGTNEPTTNATFNYRTNSWSQGTFGITASIERSVFDDPLAGDSAGNLYRLNDTVNFNGAGITAFARTKGLDLGDEQVTKLVTGVRISYIGSGLTCRLGYRDTDADSTVFSSYKAVTSGDLIPFRVSGKLIYLELFSSTTGATWDVYGIDFYGRVGGKRETV